MKYTQALIIGAGPSGLSLAYGLQGDALVVEKENTVGGLCRSITHNHGVFDIGGHSFHTPHPEVLSLVQELIPGGLFLQKRNAQVYSHGTLIPYPFQKYYDQLPFLDVVKACEDGLRTATGNAHEPQNFEEYIIRKFGSGIAEHFMLPYNRKLWARDIKQISSEWTSERVAAPKGEKETFDTKGGERKPLQPDTHVGYPPEGGFEEIYKSFVVHIPALEVDAQIIEIDPHKKIARAIDGREYTWEFLASTMPLPDLVRIVKGTPSEIIDMADQLEYMSLRVVFLLVGHPVNTDIQRIYIADPDIPPHKIAINHNSSDYLRRQPYHAIMAEASLSASKPLNANEIAPKTIDFLCKIGILHSEDDVIWQGFEDVKFAYPVYTHRRLALVQSIKDWMMQHDIYTLGRFGDWEYINSDKCVMKGLILAKELRERYQ
jgi:protoporphyrinogen oxidase